MSVFNLLVIGIAARRGDLTDEKSAISLSRACDGVVRYKSAIGLSPNTIRNCRTTFAKLKAYFESHPERSEAESKDPAFDSITRDHLTDFFAWLRDEYLSEPDSAAPRGQIKLSPKTILNVHTTSRDSGRRG